MYECKENICKVGGFFFLRTEELIPPTDKSQFQQHYSFFHLFV